ncbi:ABC transporter substrate-binding protein [Natronolimnohabitans sp. A-GB9]|uniref:ABC transporter substrate-binding protein n=1 Tax=Natronolimnohabitans sp. A-GB9 TaxID=3069757 RepID=UPI0027AF1604|nr:ABC transporter substrate-binding protein [Natronolimnohabitans sp. A-GB9]MDQ2052776.1 ABC transporter substrate-binding protein [Natronolimnohabitans sp. A-GB9]
MNYDTTGPVDGVDRRSVLAAGSAGLSLSLSGCIDSVRSVVNRDGGDQLSLSIATVPSDYDPESLHIARHLESNLQEVGIDAELTFRNPSDFLEMILLEQEYDIYVGRHPGGYDPDFLYEALHSTYASANETGWQNPYNFSDRLVDVDLADQRRRTGEQREESLERLLDTVAELKPFDPICRPTAYRLYRDDDERFTGWDEVGDFATRHGYLGLEPVDDVDRLTALVTDSRPSANINPLSPINREYDTIIDLVYDSLATVVPDDDGESEVEPWLAEKWETETHDDGRTTVTVTLREDCRFHDVDEDDDREEHVTRVTAEDVEFTYWFLNDTAFGRASVSSPAPRYRGLASAVDEIEIEDDYRLRLTVDGNVAVGERVLTVPILPRHVWVDELNDRIDDPADFSTSQGEWGLVTSSSVAPIGSGPYRFESQSRRGHLTLERFDDHFTLREDVGDGDDETHLRGPLVEELRFSVDPGSDTSIGRIVGGGADLTSSRVSSNTVGQARAAADNESDVELVESSPPTFYHVGFNTGTSPTSNELFRRRIARLIDKAWIVDEAFNDHAEPLVTPVTEAWTPERLEWGGTDPVTPFFGTDGELDEDAIEDAHRAFEAIGYRVDDEGRILG